MEFDELKKKLLHQEEVEKSDEGNVIPPDDKSQGVLPKPLLSMVHGRNKKILSICLIIMFVLSLWWAYLLIEDITTPDRSDWAYEITGIDDMHDRGIKGEGIIIGIIDTGVDLEHDELKEMSVIAWMDYIKGEEEPYDDLGHGTKIAGILAADYDLKGGVPNANFIVCKVMDKNGGGAGGYLDSNVGNAIDFCVDQGADIITISLGGGPTPLGLGTDAERSARNAVQSGVFVITSAGNDGGSSDDGEVSTPGNVESVISVGSIDRDRRISPTSSQGDNDGLVDGFPDPLDRQDPNKKPEFVAPGVEIMTCFMGNKYGIVSGTSIACPFVTSQIALYLQEHPEYRRNGDNGGNENSIRQVKQIMMETALKCPDQDTPHDSHYGYGIIDTVKATQS